MHWDLTGRRVNGLYLGLWPYTGTVESSRVKLGGDVQHTVVLDQVLRAYGSDRERILVSITEINRILDDRDAEVNDSWYDDQFETE